MYEKKRRLTNQKIADSNSSKFIHGKGRKPNKQSHKLCISNKIQVYSCLVDL